MSVDSIEPTVLKLHLENAVENLANVTENENLFLSAYFRIDRITSNLQVIVQKILQTKASLGKMRKKEVLALIKRLEETVSTFESKEDYSIAVFIRSGDEPVCIAVEVPGYFEDEVHLTHHPSIFSLVEKKDKYHRYAVVILTSVSARIIQVNAGRITRNLLAGSLDLRSSLSKEISRERYINNQEKRGMKFYKEKVSIIECIIRDNELDHIILAGESRFTSQFKSLLPTYLADKVIDETITGNIKSFEYILKSSIEAFVKQEEREKVETMQRLNHSLATGGLAIAGYEEVRQALRDYRLDTLIVSRDCPTSLADAIVKEAVMQNIAIETVDDDNLLSQHEGFAGFVRYKFYV